MYLRILAVAICSCFGFVRAQYQAKSIVCILRTGHKQLALQNLRFERICGKPLSDERRIRVGLKTAGKTNCGFDSDPKSDELPKNRLLHLSCGRYCAANEGVCLSWRALIFLWLPT